MKHWAIIRQGFIAEVLEQLKKDLDTGEWVGPNPALPADSADRLKWRACQ